MLGLFSFAPPLPLVLSFFLCLSSLYIFAVFFWDTHHFFWRPAYVFSHLFRYSVGINAITDRAIFVFGPCTAATSEIAMVRIF